MHQNGKGHGEGKHVAGGRVAGGCDMEDEECASYDVGEYEYIIGGLSLEELRDRLGR